MTYYHHAIVDSPQVPRDLDSESAQSLVITVLGELWPLASPTVVPSAAIVAILSRIGVSETAIRGALSRMQRRGTLDVHKIGRSTGYSISSEVADTIPASQLLTMGFGDGERSWSGDWTLVIFSLPEAQRGQRQALRDRLRWLGFGPVRDGVWASPRCEVEIARAALGELLPADGLILRTQEFSGAIDVESAWPVPDIREAYDRFIDDFRPYIFSLRARTVSPAEALRVWATALGRWRALPTIDPDLPLSAMPADWPQAEARRTFVAVHDGCVPLVRAFVDSILREHDPRLADDVRVLTVGEALMEYADAARRPHPRDVLRIVSDRRANG